MFQCLCFSVSLQIENLLPLAGLMHIIFLDISQSAQVLSTLIGKILPLAHLISLSTAHMLLLAVTGYRWHTGPMRQQ
jgi:hypothetical protein